MNIHHLRNKYDIDEFSDDNTLVCDTENDPIKDLQDAEHLLAMSDILEGYYNVIGLIKLTLEQLGKDQISKIILGVKTR